MKKMTVPSGAMPLRKVLVTGGAGFLGQTLVQALLEPSGAGGAPAGELEEVRILDVMPWRGGEHRRLRCICADVRDRHALAAACEGVEAVVHAGSLVDYGHATEQTLEAINVGGTRNVIEACRDAGVGLLLYTSTMDVVHAGDAIRDGDESLPYPQPDRFADAYARTKAEAERLILAADGDALWTCALRPCGMYGEGDPYHVSNVLRVVRQGRLAARIGDGSAVFQHVYVGNVAHAHVLALQRLADGDPLLRGQAYLVTDHPASNFFDFMEPLMRALGEPFPPRSRSVPYPIAFALGALLELLARLLRPLVTWRPALTRSSIRAVCKDLSFTGEKLRRDLDYAPRYSEGEAFDRTVSWFATHGPVDPPQVPAELAV
jgi:nucleoside-diphosphate-sugar epimerase